MLRKSGGWQPRDCPRLFHRSCVRGRRVLTHLSVRPAQVENLRIELE